MVAVGLSTLLVLVFLIPNHSQRFEVVAPRQPSSGVGLKPHHSSESSSEALTEPAAHAAVVGGCSSFSTVLVRDQPIFSDRHVKREALVAFYAAGAQLPLDGSNSVKVDKEDIARAEQNVVRMASAIEMSAVPCPSYSTPSKQGVDDIKRGRGFANIEREKELHYASLALYNLLRNFIQELLLDSSPIVLDFGCVLGPTFATQHPASSVVCVFLHSAIRLRAQTSQAATNLLPRRGSYPVNMFQLVTSSSDTRDFVEGELKEIYTLCNLYTLGLVLQAVDDSRWTLEEVLDHVATLAPSTHLIVAAMPQPAREGREMTCELIVETILKRAVLNSGATLSLQCDVIGVVRSKILSNREYLIVRLIQLQSSRACRKTWGAPLIQWDRSQSVTVENGTVTFKVTSVANAHKSRKSDAAASSATTVMRVIHPLQYLHSINLDHLLGAAIDFPQRLGFLGQMLMTPRYSDPLPHNWVLGGSGKLRRIDKVDLRYDRDVDESKGYWGHSTRGYMHLLAVHLCVPVRGDGLPAVVTHVNASCRRDCIDCACTCSYEDKGMLPCEYCRQCGRCLMEYAETNAHVLANDEVLPPKKCQKSYSSMDSARREWRRWEKADAKGVDDQCSSSTW